MEKRPSGKDLLLALRNLTPIFLAVVVILGGIYLGIFTPTEAAAVGCVLALILAMVFRRLSWKVIHKAALNTIEITSFIMLLIIASAILSNALAGLLIPFKLAQWASSLPLPPLAVLIMVIIFYLILGCFIESLAAMIMTLPVTFPLIVGLGFDPILFGVLTVIVIQGGTITPPVGISLYVVQGIRGKGSLGEVIAGITPFVAVMLLLTALVIAVPSLATWLPAQMITR